MTVVSQTSGSAYVFDIEDGSVRHRLLAPDAAENDDFGISVAVFENLALVGSRGGNAPGGAYLFDMQTGEFLRKLVSSDGGDNDLFGESVAMANGIAVVGSRWDDVNGTNSGSAYVFDVATGEELHKLVPPDGQPLGNFGRSISMSGKYALVGSPFDAICQSFVCTYPGKGSAYLYDVTTGELVNKILPPASDAGTVFGQHVSLSGDRALVTGAGEFDAYLYDASTGELLSGFAEPRALSDVLGVLAPSASLSANWALIA